MSDLEKSVLPAVDPMNPLESSIPLGLKRIIQAIGFIVLLLGLPTALNLLCLVPLLTFNSYGRGDVIYGVVSLMLVLLTVGAGGMAYLHARRSLHNKPSKPLQFPPLFLLVGLFIPLILLGIAFREAEFGASLFFPPVLVVCALLPPLWSVAWMIPRAAAPAAPDEAKESQAAEDIQAVSSLTWRRGLFSFTGGATVSFFIAFVLEILLPVIVLSLVADLMPAISDSMRSILRDLSNADVAAALTDPHFIYLFVQIAIIAPLAEEIAKPLVTLPLLRHLGKREAFWVGALAGAGFATLENIVYATMGFTIWAGILLVRALGGALHPFGSGLVAQGWWSALRGEKDAARNWWKRFGIAFAIHAAWNGGSLLVITLGGASFFGELPPMIGLLGLSAAGITLAFLILLGLFALWMGRAYGYGKAILPVGEEISLEKKATPSDQTLAVWALVCLIAIVPIGIAGLKLWLR